MGIVSALGQTHHRNNYVGQNFLVLPATFDYGLRVDLSLGNTILRSRNRDLFRR